MLPKYLSFNNFSKDFAVRIIESYVITVPLQSIHWREMKIYVYTKAWNMSVHSSIIHNTSKLEKNPNVHQQMNVYVKCDMSIQYNTVWE